MSDSSSITVSFLRVAEMKFVILYFIGNCIFFAVSMSGSLRRYPSLLTLSPDWNWIFMSDSFTELSLMTESLSVNFVDFRCCSNCLHPLSRNDHNNWSFKTCHPISSWFVHRSSDTDLLIFFVRLVFDKRVFVTTRTGRHIIRLVVTEWFNGFYNFFNCFGMYSNANIKFALFFWYELFKSASKCPTFCSAIDHLLILWKIVNWTCGNACNTILSQYFQSFSKLFKKFSADKILIKLFMSL